MRHKATGVSAVLMLAGLVLTAGFSLASQTADEKITQSRVDSTLAGWKAAPAKTARTIPFGPMGTTGRIN